MAEPYVYVASKSEWAWMWRGLRAAGMPIHSSWIDLPDGCDPQALWTACIEEASMCSALLAFYVEGEEWKGALVEIGAALSSGSPVVVVGTPPGSWVNHPKVTLADSLDDGINQIGTLMGGWL